MGRRKNFNIILILLLSIIINPHCIRAKDSIGFGMRLKTDSNTLTWELEKDFISLHGILLNTTLVTSISSSDLLPANRIEIEMKGRVRTIIHEYLTLSLGNLDTSNMLSVVIDPIETPRLPAKNMNRYVPGLAGASSNSTVAFEGIVCTYTPKNVDVSIQPFVFIPLTRTMGVSGCGIVLGGNTMAFSAYHMVKNHVTHTEPLIPWYAMPLEESAVVEVFWDTSEINEWFGIAGTCRWNLSPGYGYGMSTRCAIRGILGSMRYEIIRWINSKNNFELSLQSSLHERLSTKQVCTITQHAFCTSIMMSVWFKGPFAGQYQKRSLKTSSDISFENSICPMTFSLNSEISLNEKGNKNHQEKLSIAGTFSFTPTDILIRAHIPWNQKGVRNISIDIEVDRIPYADNLSSITVNIGKNKIEASIEWEVTTAGFDMKVSFDSSRKLTISLTNRP
ncbi:MAG: hypothetical protein PHH80_06020 [Sphaerochaetaceae bacterium]|nr:hypothetical protein [Sphaerochaetaceae bacterium]